MDHNLLINGVYWGYNPLTKFLVHPSNQDESVVHVTDGFDWFWITPKGVGFGPRTVLAVSS